MQPQSPLSRRAAIRQTAVALGGALAVGATHSTLPSAHAAPGDRKPFVFCLNTATIRGHKLGIVKEIEIASKAGYDAIEPWIDAIEEYQKSGGKLSDLRKRFQDAGLRVEGAIGFAEWIVDDETRRAKGLERAKHDLGLCAEIGAKRLAAPPAGATQLPKLDLVAASERYLALLQAGDAAGVTPQLELWGFAKNLSRMGECVAIAMETGHPKACVLADVYHLHKGGSLFHGVRLLSSNTVQVLHMNDYPAEPNREKIDDSFRIYAGDGVAPLNDILANLRAIGGQKVLSFEVFNRGYWQQDPLLVARTGLEKMKKVAAESLKTKA